MVSLFKNVVYPNGAQAEKLAHISRNWDVFRKHINDLTEKELIKVLMVELAHRRRPYIIRRALSRFQSLRREREENEIFINGTPIGIAPYGK